MNTPDHENASPVSIEHEAMATTFVLRIHHPDAPYARKAAMAAFRECDRLEAELSRFVESSSITRLNRAKAGTEVPISADVYLCLKQALRISEATDGAFDIGFRSRMAAASPAFMHAVRLSGSRVAASPTRDSPDLDLGAIGKGFAIDRMAEVLAEWDVHTCLLAGGWSSLLAMSPPPGKPGWPVNLHESDGPGYLLPEGGSISASGFDVKGAHIATPATGAAPETHRRTWALARSATVSDALSTAFMVMGIEQIRSFTYHFPECGAALLNDDLQLISLGTEFVRMNQ